jgi:carbonic anhydrase
MSAIDDSVCNNAGYAKGFAKGGLPMPPAKKIAILACMDARLETGAMLGLEEGDAHVIRNAGGVVTDDAIRSLVISQRLLGSREIMLIHHTDCGMLTFSDAELKDAIHAETGGDVRQSIARLEASPFIPHKDQIRGFVYDVASGLLREVARQGT